MNLFARRFRDHNLLRWGSPIVPLTILVYLISLFSPVSIAKEPQPFSNVPRESLEIGGRVIVSGQVLLTSLSFNSALKSILNLHLISPSPTRFIANSHSYEGKAIDLGHYPPGTELIFGISQVPGSPSLSWVTGPANRNPDITPHNVLAWIDSRNLVIGFEDMPRGGDRDYQDVIFRLTLPPVYKLRFTPLPSSVLPTSRKRTYVDTLRKRQLFPHPQRLEPLLCRVEVQSSDGAPVNSLKVRVYAASEAGESGHLNSKHKIKRPNPWLLHTPPPLPAEKSDATSRPMTEVSDVASLDMAEHLPSANDSQQIKIKAVREMQPGTNLRLNSVIERFADQLMEPGEAGGDLSEEPLELVTDESGVAEFYYIPSEIAGIETLTAELADISNIQPIQQSITVKTGELLDLSRIKFHGQLVRGKDVHLSHFWVTPQTSEKIKKAAHLYAEKKANDTEIRELIRELTGRNYSFPDLLTQNKVVTQKADIFYLLAASLPWGGLFDPTGDYSTAYWGHRDGRDVDLMTRHLVHGDPLTASQKEAVGDANLREIRDLAGDLLVRRLQYRRLQLMIAALKEVGGYFIPSDAQFTEGEHLHVTFGEPPPITTSDMGINGSGSTGLKPANPNHPLPK